MHASTINRNILLALTVLAHAALFAASPADKAKHELTFSTGEKSEFLLDGRPFQMIGGEMHPSRIPAAYWRHRIQMAKAMGMNTIPIYVFWNEHEREGGVFDFTSEARDIGRFIDIAQEEGLWVALRPGPYCCGEWDLGGLPAYLLSEQGQKMRCSDPVYLRGVERYIQALVKVVRPRLAQNGGPILITQIENEYGSYNRRDHAYMVWLRDQWVKEGVPGPFYTADGAGEHYLKGIVVPGVAVGLDTGTKEEHFALARKLNPGVPVMSSEVYPGWLRHWGERDWAPTNVKGLVDFYMKNNYSFCLYVIHGGTCFGFTAGANVGGNYQPDLTSYDYGSPIDEQGNATPAYHAYRAQLASYLPAGTRLPEIPAPVPSMALAPVTMKRWTTLWEQAGKAVSAETPAYFESKLLGVQNQGVVIYRTTLPAGSKGKLKLDQRDFAQVFVDGNYIGALDRRAKQHEIDLPEAGGKRLEILVEAMGHINFKEQMETDRKGLLSAKLEGVELKNWEMFAFPLKEGWISKLAKTEAPATKPGGFFKGTFRLEKTADTFLDMKGHGKGTVWVNGHNLGRYWNIGPQFRLFCPAPWLKAGENEIMVLELLDSDCKEISGVPLMR